MGEDNTNDNLAPTTTVLPITTETPPVVASAVPATATPEVPSIQPLPTPTPETSAAPASAPTPVLMPDPASSEAPTATAVMAPPTEIAPLTADMGGAQPPITPTVATGMGENHVPGEPDPNTSAPHADLANMTTPADILNEPSKN